MPRPNFSEKDLEAIKHRLMVRSGGMKERGGVVGHARKSLTAPVLRHGPSMSKGVDPTDRARIGEAGENPAPSPLLYKGQVYKSKTEIRFVQHLEALEFGKFITSWQYEPCNFRLPGQKNYYKPDFLVCDSHGLTFYDTKGWNKSDARSLVKIKTAAGLNRWARFIQVKWIKGVWEERLICT